MLKAERIQRARWIETANTLPVEHSSRKTATQVRVIEAASHRGAWMQLCNALQLTGRHSEVLFGTEWHNSTTRSLTRCSLPCRQPPLPALDAPGIVRQILIPNHDYSVLSVTIRISNRLTNRRLFYIRFSGISDLFRAMFDEAAVHNPTFDPAVLRPYNQPL